MWNAVGTGWKLVRRVGPGAGTWHPATDHLAGTNVYGVKPSVNAQAADVTYSVSFSGDSFTKFLFATGDEEVWLVCTKEAVGGAPYGSVYYAGIPRNILMSSDSLTPYQAIWYNRAEEPVDPWISLNDHMDAIMEAKILYGEESWVDTTGLDRRHHILQDHNGVNVWIDSG